MSFTRIPYDDSAAKSQNERSSGPGIYRLYAGVGDNCQKCFSYNGPANSNADVSVARSGCGGGFGNMIDVESSLSNRNLPLGECNDEQRKTGYLSHQSNIVNTKPCSNFLERSESRFTHPLDSYRGMSTFDYALHPHLAINPQCNIYNGEELSTRLHAKDTYVMPEQTLWDDGSSLPDPNSTQESQCPPRWGYNCQN